MALTYPCYRVYKDSKGEWRWTYHAKNGEPIGVSSEGYKNKADCSNGVTLMKVSSTSPTYESP